MLRRCRRNRCFLVERLDRSARASCSRYPPAGPQSQIVGRSRLVSRIVIAFAGIGIDRSGSAWGSAARKLSFSRTVVNEGAQGQALSKGLREGALGSSRMGAVDHADIRRLRFG